MSQPRWSNEEFAAITASHRELVNHWLKSPIESSPPSNLARDSASISSSCEELKCTAKEIQDLFNHLDLVDRALLLNYAVTWLSWKAVSPALETRLGQPAVTVLLRFRSQDALVIFDVHAFRSYQAEILASRMLDPKSLAFLGKVYFSTLGAGAA